MCIRDRTDVNSASFDAKSAGASDQASRTKYLIVKRVIDVLFIASLAPLLFLLVLLAALPIWLTDRSAPFYTQRRVGRDGRQFRMLKLRTMVPNADQTLESYLASNEEARREWEQHQKLKNDPRITRFGRFLRKTSLDELPQVWNVLSGDMSLVGPRPIMVHQEPLYPGRSYYNLRPGITGLWQVSERDGSSFADRAVYDDEYYRRASLRLDLKVLLATFKLVAFSSFRTSSDYAETSASDLSGEQDALLNAKFEGMLRLYRSEIGKYQLTLDRLKESNTRALSRISVKRKLDG